MPRTLMAVHAHPDDESFTTGGILTRYAAEGVHTVVVTCTGGEVGEISEGSLATPETLGEVRAQEMEAACRILGVGEFVALGYRDSGMMGTPDNEHPDCFWQADLDAATRRLVGIVRRTRPDVIVTYDERGDYGHPDHINAHRIAVAAFDAAGDPARYPEEGPEPWVPKKLYYSAWPRSRNELMRRLLAEAGIDNPFSEEEDQGEDEYATPDELVTTSVDVSAYVDTKAAALLAHRTQMGPGSWLSRVPESIWRQLWRTEYFRRAQSRVPAPEREDDLFAGLRDDQ